MASANVDDADLNNRFESWLKTKLNASDEESDKLLICSFIMNTLGDEETGEDEKKETMKPLLEELNNCGSASQSNDSTDKLLDTIIESWNRMKLEEEEKEASINKSIENDASNR